MTVFLALLLYCSSSHLLAEEPEPAKVGDFYSFQLENDSTKVGGPGTDRDYTSGFKFSYGYAADRIPKWLPLLTGWSDFLTKELKAAKTNYILSLAQKLYTPRNLQATAPIPNDQPYAGWLYAGFGANFKTGKHSHSLELDLGTVGPNALGEQVQNTLHRAIGDQTAKGWGNQLRNEPAAELSYQMRSRWFEIKHDSGNYLDVIPYFGAAVGNVYDAVQLGGMFRLGYHLPDDLGPSRPSTLGSDAYTSPRRVEGLYNNLGIYSFIGAAGNGVAHNIFLDGNTFQNSARVTRIPFVLNTEMGLAGRLYNWFLAWRYVTISPEFEERRQFNSFGSVSIVYSRPIDITNP
jgi:lipid A 3-O-deacylase